MGTIRCVQHVGAWGRPKHAVHDWPDEDATWDRIYAGVLSPVDDFTPPPEPPPAKPAAKPSKPAGPKVDLGKPGGVLRP